MFAHRAASRGAAAALLRSRCAALRHRMPTAAAWGTARPAAPAAAAAAVACQRRHSSSRSDAKGGEESAESARASAGPAKKMSAMEMLREYGTLGLVLVQLEYFVMWAILYAICSMLPVAPWAVEALGEDRIMGVMDYLVALPWVGDYLASLAPETLLNLTISAIADEITWFIRAPFVMLAIPRVARLLRVR